MSYEGSCLCGKVCFVVDTEITDVSHCHCSMCRKTHGAAFATYGNVPSKHFFFTKGKAAMYQSSLSVTRFFCRACGSPLLWSDSMNHPGVVSFPIGALDSLFEVPKHVRNIHTETRVSWHADVL